MAERRDGGGVVMLIYDCHLRKGLELMYVCAYGWCFWGCVESASPDMAATVDGRRGIALGDGADIDDQIG